MINLFEKYANVNLEFLLILIYKLTIKITENLLTIFYSNLFLPDG